MDNAEVIGRKLTCRSCGEVVEVFEFEFVRHTGFVDAAFTDPDRYWCVPCLDSRYWDLYPQCREAVESRQREKPVVTLPVFEQDELDTQTRWDEWSAA